MKRALGRDMFLVFAVLAFACLLLGGGSRLIASPEAPSSPILPREGWLSASLTCPPSAQMQEIEARRVQEERPISASILYLHADEIGPCPPQTDANGNILRQASYMRAVYQAFALGDGFA